MKMQQLQCSKRDGSSSLFMLINKLKGVLEVPATCFAVIVDSKHSLLPWDDQS